MKVRRQRSRVTHIPRSRWLAYATAGAATALSGPSPAEAEIHYSGRIDTFFPADESKSVAFALDQPGDSLTFVRGQDSSDFFGVRCPKSGAFVGSNGSVFEAYYVFRIHKAQQNRYISQDPFSSAGFGALGAFGTMVKGTLSSFRWRWLRKGTDFVGFRFNNGAGKQYGWARVHMDGPDSKFSFTVVDYAWADPGEPIKPGQISSSVDAGVTDENSLGFLAAGAAGLVLSRWKRN